MPQPDEVSTKDRENGFGAYIMMFAGAYFPVPFVEIISSIIYYLYFKKRSRYAAFHAYQSFLAQLPVTILNTALLIYGIRMLIIYIRTEMITTYELKTGLAFLLITVLINIIYIIISLIIALKAKNGIFAYFPIVGRMAYEKMYGPNAIEISSKTVKDRINHPPE